MQNAINICEKWTDVTFKLTSSYWSGNDHLWDGPPYTDSYITAFRDRLTSVVSIHTASDELSVLLSAEERKSFRLDRLFEPLEDSKPLNYSPYTNHQWLKAVAEHERLVDPVEAAVAAKLR